RRWPQRIFTLLRNLALVLQRLLTADRLSRAVKTSAITGLEQRRCSVGAGPEFIGLNLLTVAAVLMLRSSKRSISVEAGIVWSGGLALGPRSTPPLRNVALENSGHRSRLHRHWTSHLLSVSQIALSRAVSGTHVRPHTSEHSPLHGPMRHSARRILTGKTRL